MKTRSIAITSLLFVMMLSLITQAAGTTPTEKPSIYNADGKGLERIEQALVLAQMDNKRVLLQIGGDWCSWCHKLYNLLQQDDTLRAPLRSEYVLVMIDNQADKAVLEKWNIHPSGYPYLVVLDANSTKLTEQETGSLEIGQRHDPAKVKAFLEQWKPAPWDARTVLQASLAQAKKDNKQVFFKIGSPSCGWCIRMGEFLAQPQVRSLLDKDFVILQIDLQRMTHGMEVAEKIRQDGAGGIPWFAFLDQEGKVLQTSNNEQGQNIGFPVRQDTEIPYFKKMLTQARKHMTSEDVESVIKELQAFTKQWQ